MNRQAVTLRGMEARLRSLARAAGGDSHAGVAATLDNRGSARAGFQKVAWKSLDGSSRGWGVINATEDETFSV